MYSRKFATKIVINRSFGGCAAPPILASISVAEAKVASRGGKNAKKRAVVAVARKLSVLYHSLWVSGEIYEPLRNTHRSSGGQAA